MNKRLLLIVATLFSSYANAQNHLLLSEISLAPDAGEFVEIYNTTSATIPLDNYYLADNAEYALLPSGSTNVLSSDFIIQFPAGFSITNNNVIVIAASAIDFNLTFGINPDFEVNPTDPNVPDMILIDVGSAPTLTNGGEGIVLFYWDGATDLVTDVDMMNAGVPSAANQIASKTGVSVDGPDVNTIPENYLSDAATMPLQASTTAAGMSTKRIYPEGTNEIHTGGNGITGDDETTENILITWDATFTAPTPGIPNLLIGIASLENNILSIYPNPSSDYFRLSFADNFQSAELKIYDLAGKLVYSQRINSDNTFVHHKLNSGVYFVSFADGEVMRREKLVVE